MPPSSGYAKIGAERQFQAARLTILMKRNARKQHFEFGGPAMNHDLSDYFLYALAVVLVFFILGTGAAAYAGMIDTEQVVAGEQLAQERERVKALLDRQDVAKQMQVMGVSPGDAQGRIDAMTDQEVRMLAGRLDTLPAAGLSFSNTEIIIILLLIVILAVAL